MALRQVPRRLRPARLLLSGTSAWLTAATKREEHFQWNWNPWCDTGAWRDPNTQSSAAAAAGPERTGIVFPRRRRLWEKLIFCIIKWKYFLKSPSYCEQTSLSSPQQQRKLQKYFWGP